MSGGGVMTLQSMTGFARVDGGDKDCTWYWEVRTVNAKGLDVRARLPAGHDALEPKIRQACARKFKRGNCAVNLFVQREASGVGVALNEAVLASVLEAAEQAARQSGLAKPTLDSLLNVRGVLEVSEQRDDDATRAARFDALMDDLEKALDLLVTARSEEGDRMQSALSAQVNVIEGLVEKLTSSPGRSIEDVRQRLQTKVDRLIADHEGVDPQRLHQEVVLLATKADIEEELARLTSHIVAARDLLSRDEPVGRQMDFLAQEFNREANTVCSKSTHETVTTIGMELKTVIDQFREQVQNIE